MLRGKLNAQRSAFTLIELLSVVAIVGILATLGYPRLTDSLERARVARAIGDLRTVSQELNTLDSLPTSLAVIGRAGMVDPWGRPYTYLRFPPAKGKAPPAGARKDRFLVPINSRYDLYSRGRDGNSKAPLTAASSQDDVIVANDGAFVGLARKY